MPHDGIVVQGMNQMGYYSRNYLPMYVSRTYLTASYHGTLGHAFPVGLGAKIARPDRAVVVLSGDGGFLYNSQELATAVQHRIPVVVVVFNDNAYGNVLRAQLEDFDGHVLGSRLHNPDFAALARSYGARGVKAEGGAELEAALEEALGQEAPTLIEVPDLLSLLQVGAMKRVFSARVERAGVQPKGRRQKARKLLTVAAGSRSSSTGVSLQPKRVTEAALGV